MVLHQPGELIRSKMFRAMSFFSIAVLVYLTGPFAQEPEEPGPFLWKGVLYYPMVPMTFTTSKTPQIMETTETPQTTEAPEEYYYYDDEKENAEEDTETDSQLQPEVNQEVSPEIDDGFEQDMARPLLPQPPIESDQFLPSLTAPPLSINIESEVDPATKQKQWPLPPRPKYPLKLCSKYPNGFCRRTCSTQLLPDDSNTCRPFGGVCCLTVMQGNVCSSNPMGMCGISCKTEEIPDWFNTCDGVGACCLLNIWADTNSPERMFKVPHGRNPQWSRIRPIPGQNIRYSQPPFGSVALGIGSRREGCDESASWKGFGQDEEKTYARNGGVTQYPHWLLQFRPPTRPSNTDSPGPFGPQFPGPPEPLPQPGPRNSYPVQVFGLLPPEPLPELPLQQPQRIYPSPPQPFGPEPFMEPLA